MVMPRRHRFPPGPDCYGECIFSRACQMCVISMAGKCWRAHVREHGSAAALLLKSVLLLLLLLLSYCAVLSLGI